MGAYLDAKQAATNAGCVPDVWSLTPSDHDAVSPFISDLCFLGARVRLDAKAKVSHLFARKDGEVLAFKVGE
jgi:hypothetical protein